MLMVYVMVRSVVLAVVGLVLLLFPGAAVHVPISSAQPSTVPCGVVDAFGWPVPNIDVENPDFAIYRARFGGLHTGIDVAFEQLGMPVQAAARGLVTYSDPEGWDTEKGVVVIQHTMPDGSLVNSLYGHMEQLNGYVFPTLNQCVEQGDIVGAVGFPSRGRPHLHYEIRTRFRYEGGPGYADVNPLELGWLHPIDFTYLARIWALPAYRAHFSLTERATVPPLVLSDGSLVLARSGHLVSLTTAGDTLWRFDTLGSVAALLELPDRRVLTVNSSGQVLVLLRGGYSALWQLPARAVTPPLLVGQQVVFGVEGGVVLAFSPDGVPQWEVSTGGQVVRWTVGSGERVALATDTNELWVLNAVGAVLHRARYDALPIPIAGPDTDLTVLNGSTIARLDDAGLLTPIVDTGRAFLPSAEVWFGPGGEMVLYTGEGRALYAYTPGGDTRWIAFMPGSHLRPPRVAVGSGALIYALTYDGQLLVFDARDGRLLRQLALYNGGSDGTSMARWLDVAPDDTVRFNSGYLSYVTLYGPDLTMER